MDFFLHRLPVREGFEKLFFLETRPDELQRDERERERAEEIRIESFSFLNFVDVIEFSFVTSRPEPFSTGVGIMNVLYSFLCTQATSCALTSDVSAFLCFLNA